jgi:glucosamine--fructose-6-phosphate aminotransferase (isomerizing)
VLAIPKADEASSAVLTTVALQLFAYHVAVQLGTDVDQPRNLAKSVTVE